jgi:hypothetical protein
MGCNGRKKTKKKQINICLIKGAFFGEKNFNP